MQNLNTETTEKNDLEINNLPNRLTIFRILLIPIVIGSLQLSQYDFLPEEVKIELGWVAAWIFVVASLTDFFDGYIARKKNIVTVFGSFLDPIADKFLTVSSLIMLGTLKELPAIIVIVLVLREMYMTSLRLLALNEGISVPVNNLGKWKTATQMVGIPLVMCNQQWQSLDLPLIGLVLIYLASLLSIWSAIVYTYNMIQKLKLSRALKKEQKRLKKQGKGKEESSNE